MHPYKNANSKKKYFCSRGANSFLEVLAPIEKGGIKLLPQEMYSVIQSDYDFFVCTFRTELTLKATFINIFSLFFRENKT